MIAEQVVQWLEVTRRLREEQSARAKARAVRAENMKRVMAAGFAKAAGAGRPKDAARARVELAALQQAPAAEASSRRRPLWEDLPRVKPGRTTVAPAVSQNDRRKPPAAPASAATKARQLAAGYQPAVVKIVSYGAGAGRASAMGKYVQREGVALETHDGRLLEDHAAVAAEMDVWAQGFDKRRPSDDVMTVRMRVGGVAEDPEGRQRLAAAVEAGFAGHRHAYRIERGEDGGLEATVVAALAGRRTERDENGDQTIKDRFYLSDARQRGPRDLSSLSRRLIAQRAAEGVGADRDGVEIAFSGAAHGKNGATYHLAELARGGPAQRDDGKRLATDVEARTVAASWAKQLDSREARDVMHLVLSAKAGADPQAVTNAARSFLKENFADHKFAFGLHTDKLESAGHMHVHAIVAVRGETGQRLRPGPTTLRAWRESYAAHAQEQGLKIVATSAAERASMQSYGAKDKAIVDAAERPRPQREAADRAYARANADLVDNARRRIERARTNPVRIPESEKQKAAVNESLHAWRGILSEQPHHPVAGAQVIRLTKALECANVLTEVSRASASISQRAAMSDATAEQMRSDLRELNTKLADTAATLSGETRQHFMQRSAAAMERMALQTDLKAMQERGVTQISAEDLAKLAGPATDRLLAKARAIETVEHREAATADQIVDRTVERQRRDGAEPASLAQVATDRDLLRQAETAAARERREAQAATTIARDLSQNPGQPINPAQVEDARLSDLKREQDRVIDKAKSGGTDGDGADRERPHRQKM